VRHVVAWSGWLNFHVYSLKLQKSCAQSHGGDLYTYIYCRPFNQGQGIPIKQMGKISITRKRDHFIFVISEKKRKMSIKSHHPAWGKWRNVTCWKTYRGRERYLFIPILNDCERECFIPLDLERWICPLPHLLILIMYDVWKISPSSSFLLSCPPKHTNITRFYCSNKCTN
jgi:hypothetical protein